MRDAAGKAFPTSSQTSCLTKSIQHRFYTTVTEREYGFEINSSPDDFKLPLDFDKGICEQRLSNVYLAMITMFWDFQVPTQIQPPSFGLESCWSLVDSIHNVRYTGVLFRMQVMEPFVDFLAAIAVASRTVWNEMTDFTSSPGGIAL